MKESSGTDRRPVRALVVHGGNRGTTATIANNIVQGMSEQGAKASSIPLTLLRLMPSRANDADILGVGSPVYFLREPPNVTEFVMNLPSLEGRRAFVFCTCGMDRVGETLHRLVSMLRARGANIVGAAQFRTAMSYFPYRKRGLGNPDSLPDENQLAAAREFGARMAGAQALPAVSLTPVSKSVQWKAKLLANRRFRRTMFPGVKLVASDCTSYGSCLSRCAFEALVRRDGNDIPEVTSSCIQCLECIGDCPRAAIAPDSPFKEWLSTLSYRLGIH